VTKSSDLLQGTLDLLILKVLTLEPMHGWAIAQRIHQLGIYVDSIPVAELELRRALRDGK
jgi:DNA-binding PadR family transcriptional regulator